LKNPISLKASITLKINYVKNINVMQFSVIVCVLACVISLFSLGYMGIGLYLIAYPILITVFSEGIKSWPSDWFRPVMTFIAIVWSIGFLIAGKVYLYLKALDWTKLTLKLSYVATLQIWNVFIWFVVLISFKH